jgi:phospholipid/cholesterol/gamma-HCH transport system substrate-binding protein
MRADRVGYFIVGLFVVVMLAGLVGLLTVLAGRGAQTVGYETVYANVSGLKFGTPVFFEGFQAGQIERIEPITVEDHTEFRIELSVRADLSIPDDSEVLIVQPNLLSGRALSVKAGRSKTTIPVGGRIPGGSTTGLAALPGLVSGGQDVIENARALMVEATGAMAAIKRWVNEDMIRITANYESLPLVLQGEAQALSAEARSTVLAANAVIERANLFLNEANAGSVSRSLGNVETLTNDLVKTSADLRTLSNDTRIVVEQIRALISDNKTDIEGSVVDMRYTMETIAERIDSVTYNLEGTSRNMYEFSRQIRINPGLLLGGTAAEEALEAGAER